jgi:DNA-directed RNA polymerase specialized sigma subunit
MVGFSREREALILANLDLVAKLASHTSDPEEFFSVGQLALVLAAGRHDLSLPQEAFRAYARRAIARAFGIERRQREAHRALLRGYVEATPQTVRTEEEYQLEDLSEDSREVLAAEQNRAALEGRLPERTGRKYRARLHRLVAKELSDLRT